MYHRLAVSLLLLVLLCGNVLLAQAAEPLERAHAHNDYLHRRPLLDALDCGFCSVEADIFVVDNKLLVAHTRLELHPERTLQKLYLDPLRERVKQLQGKVHGSEKQFTLMIDLKSDAAPTYEALDRVLAEYRDLLCRSEGERFIKGPIRVIISGNRPTELVLQDQECYVGIDGRLSDLTSNLSPQRMPLISDNWNNHFQWRGIGEISEADLTKLRSIVQQTHAAGRRLRFWAIPDVPAVWRLLHKEGVDLINTDRLEDLAEVLSE